jgi:two-component system, OmpR family, KDP operon response regulator KdpE
MTLATLSPASPAAKLVPLNAPLPGQARHILLAMPVSPWCLDLLGKLSEAGYVLHHAINPNAAMKLAEQHRFDLIIVDSEKATNSLLKLSLHIASIQTSGLIVKGREERVQFDLALKSGADHYVGFHQPLSRWLVLVEATLRRIPPAPSSRTVFSCGRLQIDYLARRVWVDQRETFLSPMEYKLLTFLARNQGRVLPKLDILRNVWGSVYDDEVLFASYVREYIRHLRRKIEEDYKRPKLIITQPGVGYMFMESCR